MKKLTNLTENDIYEMREILATNAQLQRPHSAEELELILHWAFRTAMEFTMLNMTVKGNLGVQVVGGEVIFTMIKPPRGWKPSATGKGGSSGPPQS